MTTRDTSKGALRTQFTLLRGTSGARRIAVAVELTALARDLAWAGLRARHPLATAEELEHEYRVLLFGRELAERVRAEARTRLAGGGAAG